MPPSEAALEGKVEGKRQRMRSCERSPNCLPGEGTAPTGTTSSPSHSATSRQRDHSTFSRLRNMLSNSISVPPQIVSRPYFRPVTQPCVSCLTEDASTRLGIPGIPRLVAGMLLVGTARNSPDLRKRNRSSHLTERD